MTFYATTNVMDSGLAWLRSSIQRINLCTTAPNNFAEASSSGATAICITKGATFLGAIAALADGSSKGRVLTVPISTNQVVCHGNTGTHAALVNITSAKLLYVTELQTNRAVTTADKVNFPTWTITIRPPTSS